MDKASKKRLKKVLTWISMALVVLLLAVMPLLAQKEAQADGPQESVLSALVEKKDLSFSLHGGGSLESPQSQDVKLPEGVKITQFLVKNGDVVRKDDPVANVDKVSVMTAITELTQTLEYLQEQIDASANDTVSSTVSAKAGGRVKQVYAQAGDSVQQVMLEHGALAVLSLDGKMAVELEASASVGSQVTLSFPDGTEAEGRVESSLDGRTVVTLEDKGYAPGEVVTVAQDGKTMGSGTLFIHSAWKATAFTGTVSTVYAKEETTVYDGAALFTLKDTDFTAQQESAASLHREYEALLQKLFRMYETGTIPAPCDGVVSGVDKDSPFLLAGEMVAWEAVPLARESTGWTVMLLSNGETAPAQTVPTEPAPTETLPEETLPMTNAIGYAGKITQVGINGLVLTMNPVSYPVTAKPEGGWDLSQVSLDPSLMIAANVLYPAASVSGYTAGDIIVILFDESGNLLEMVTAQKAQPQQPAVPDLGGMDISGILGAMGGMSGSMGTGMYGAMGGYPGTGQSQDFAYFDLEGQVLLTVTSQEEMKLTITLDEQDIAQVEPGQVATVTLDALRGQRFDAQVTKVGIQGSGNGGSSKFAVELTLDKDASMLPGMSAAATIPLFTQMQIPAVPTAALVDQGAETVVYTALDPETGKPADPVRVVTGVSDGEYTQIREGLAPGTTVYYTYYDTLELDTSAQESRFGF